MMKVILGKKGLKNSYQKGFSEEIGCKCGGIARIAFTAIEERNEETYICDLHKNEGKGGFWPHDAIAVAINFSKECIKSTVLWNQA